MSTAYADVNQNVMYLLDPVKKQQLSGYCVRSIFVTLSNHLEVKHRDNQYDIRLEIEPTGSYTFMATVTDTGNGTWLVADNSQVFMSDALNNETKPRIILFYGDDYYKHLIGVSKVISTTAPKMGFNVDVTNGKFTPAGEALVHDTGRTQRVRLCCYSQL
jgi:hypothetical protein